MAFELVTWESKAVLVGLVAIFGALGGFAAELLKTREIAGREEDGTIELGRRLNARFYDFGASASVVLGVIVAGIAMGVFQPIEEVAVDGGSEQRYDVFQVFALCAIAGFSAPKFLHTARERLLAMMAVGRMETALVDAKAVGQAGSDDADKGKAVAAVVDAALLPDGRRM